MKYAEVVVHTPLTSALHHEPGPLLAPSARERTFSYSIPTRLTDQVAVGQLVWVPFGARRLQGVVVALCDTSPVETTKDIDAVVELRPFLSSSQIDLAYWIARTYLCSLDDALQLMLPPGVEQGHQVVLSLSPEASDIRAEAQGLRLNARQTALVEWLARSSETRLAAVPTTLRGAVDSLVKRGIVHRQTRLAPPRVKPKRIQAVRLVAEEALATLEAHDPAVLVLEFLAQANTVLPTVKEVCAAAQCAPSTLNRLVRNGWIEIAPAQELIALTSRYSQDLPARPAAQARTLVYLRERATPVPTAELRNAIKASALVLRALEAKGYIERTCTEPAVLLKLEPRAAIEQAKRLRKTGRYAAIVDYLRAEKEPVWISAVYAATGCSRGDLQKLAAAGVVTLEEQEVWRDPLASRAFEVVEPPVLTPGQQAVWQEIVTELHRFRLQSYGLPVTSSKLRVSELQGSAEQPETLKPAALKPAVFLLHGVTGSGKTEIYLRALAETVAQGRQGIVLVPEIALTPQTIRRFGARFKRLAVLHSRLSLGERYDTWRRCRDGHIDLVIGSRSALFAPLPRLGLIVLDEEHEPAYKQESAPHYHARQVAIEWARRVGATVILGSATPDVETYYRATRGEFKLLELPQRIMGHRGVIESTLAEFGLRGANLAVREVSTGYRDARYLDLPPVQVVDLRAELKAGNRSIFSRALQQELAHTLVRREQAILFLNRRGAATFVLCRDCGNVFRCKRCDSPMTYHLTGQGLGGLLICHHCNRRDRVPSRCPACGSVRIRYFGVGTQRVEEEIHALFPKARTLRWDFDVTRGKESHEALLERFVQHQADILIGTQMIAKGLDLPLVTLVGVVSADTSLNLPDFRAGERTFQLLTQVAGRAGRSILGGRVILQTYNPEHYAVQAASQHDYRTFYARERAFREEQGYPPFRRLIRLLFVHPNEKRCVEETTRLHRALSQRIAQLGLPALDFIGPAPAFFQRVRGEYRYQLIARGRDPHALLADITLPLGWRVDVDPASVL